MQQNELRARGVDMPELDATQRMLPISSVYYSLARMGEMCDFERPHRSFWFGCGIRATLLGSTFDGEEQ
jgi:hypothetical protein